MCVCVCVCVFSFFFNEAIEKNYDLRVMQYFELFNCELRNEL